VPPEEALSAAWAPEGDPARGAPLLRSRRGRRRDGGPPPTEALRYTALYDSLKDHLARRGKLLERRDPLAAAKFKDASTHWLRHTCATLALKDGVPLNTVQRLLRRASLTTTSTYVIEQEEALMAAMERFVVQAACV
jgi:integrase